jgi:uncharacterized membrane protein YoaK (UPF0700 family)
MVPDRPVIGSSDVPVSNLYHLVFASFATALAGFLDAVGYDQLSHLYVSFMSGNSTHLGTAVAAGQVQDVVFAGSVIAAFVGGAFIGTLIGDIAVRPTSALLLTEIALCIVAIGSATHSFATAAMTLIALTMGMQNVMHQGVSGTDAGKSFVTGALFGFGQSVAKMVRGVGPGMHAVVHATSWLSFVAGVVCGALSIKGWGLVPSLAWACGGMFLLLVLSWGKAFCSESPEG